jgi:hypothetical protein
MQISHLPLVKPNPLPKRSSSVGSHTRPDIANQVRSAEAFLEAYRRCDPEEEVEDPSKIALPAIVCGAFACEVAIKSLLELHGKTARGHDLLRLFKILPSHVQLQVFEGTCLTEDKFWQELERARCAFEEWRYFYEDRASFWVNVGFLGSLATVVLAIVARIENEA